MKRKSIIVALCMLLPIANASTSSATDKSIAKVKVLYGKAYPMEMNAPERKKLLDEAEAILKTAIKDDPESLEAHRKLLGVYTLKQDYSNGIRTIQEAITLSPKDEKLFVTLAVFYYKTGSLQLADKILNQALVLDPDYVLAKEFKTTIKKSLAAQEKDHLAQKPMDAVHGGGARPAKAH